MNPVLPLPGSAAAPWWTGRFAGNAADDRLVHDVIPVRGILAAFGKAELGARRGARHSDGEVPAEIAFDVGSLVAFASGAPGINTEHRKITDTALASVRSRDEVLRCLPSGPVRNAI